MSKSKKKPEEPPVTGEDLLAAAKLVQVAEELEERAKVELARAENAYKARAENAYKAAQKHADEATRAYIDLALRVRR